MKKALVAGAGGFIGGHLVKRLKDEGYWVRGVDLKHNEFEPSVADDFVIGDLRDVNVCNAVLEEDINEVYQLAADMGGAGFVFTGDNDADIMHNSALINLNIAKRAAEVGVERLFYSSSACIYPEYNQLDPLNPKCSEESAYPAAPDSEYGWEKLFSERLFLSFLRNYKLPVRIARFHNIFGEFGTWTGGREKAPAAICRKVAEVEDGCEIEIWGDGEQTRSFLHVSECVEGIRRLVKSDFTGPVNIGSEEMVTINEFVEIVKLVANKPNVRVKHIDGPQGVRGRNSDNHLILERLNWEPSIPLIDGVRRAYKWIEGQIALSNRTAQNIKNDNFSQKKVHIHS